ETTSLFRHIHTMPPASVWAWNHGCIEKRQYFAPSQWECQEVLESEAFQSEFQQTLSTVLPRYISSKTQLGVSLTAGLDTRMVMAALPQRTQAPVCYTYTAANRDVLDCTIAAEVARRMGLRHEALRVDEDFFTDFAALADKTVMVSDGCFGITGAHEVYLNAKARALGTVRLTGVFGGEVMRGVSTFKPSRFDTSLLAEDIRADVVAARQFLDGEPIHPVTAAAFREIPWNIFGSVAACKSQIEFRTPFLDNDLVALFYRMPAALRSSSQVAERVIRELRPELAGVATDMGYLGDRPNWRRVLGKTWAKLTFKLDYYGNDGMPCWLSTLDPLLDNCGIIGRHKYLRYRRWFRSSLADYVRERLADSSVTQSPLWNQKAIAALAEEHITGRRNRQVEIDTILTVAAIERLLLNNGVARAAVRKSPLTVPSGS
ncbi:MAG: asparagine synthase-related protein, partial [Verrucomicrobiales bacterium]